MENPDKQEVFVGKDDGIERKVEFFIEGKYGKIGIIRSDKPASVNDKQEYIDTFVKIVARSAAAEDKAKPLDAC